MGARIKLICQEFINVEEEPEVINQQINSTSITKNNFILVTKKEYSISNTKNILTKIFVNINNIIHFE